MAKSTPAASRLAICTDGRDVTGVDLDAMIARLDEVRALEWWKQFEAREEINAMFDTAWRAGVDRDTFFRLFRGIVLSPEMLWTVGRVPPDHA